MKWLLIMTGLLLGACSNNGSGPGSPDAPYSTVGHNADLEVSLELELMAGAIRCTIEVAVEPDQGVTTVLALALDGIGEAEYAPLQIVLSGEGTHIVFYENYGPILGAKAHAVSTAEDRTAAEAWAEL